MKTIGTLAVAVVFVLAGTGLALAQPGGGRGWGPGPGPGIERIIEELDLEPSQKEEVLGILEKYHEGTLADLRAELEEASRGLRLAVHDPEAGEQQVLEASRAVSVKAERMALERHRMFIEIGRVLTPDQQASLLEMIEKGPGPGPGWHRHGPRHNRPGRGW